MTEDINPDALDRLLHVVLKPKTKRRQELDDLHSEYQQTVAKAKNYEQVISATNAFNNAMNEWRKKHSIT
jgi:predicted 2-oxoglutarate/Fe(II)-dependent dioxygenase YbiX